MDCELDGTFFVLKHMCTHVNFLQWDVQCNAVVRIGLLALFLFPQFKPTP